MTVQFWIGQEFATTHERAALCRFLKDMQARFGQSDDLYLVLVNYYIGGRQVTKVDSVVKTREMPG